MQNMIANNDIDLVIFFHSADLEQDAESMNLAEISRLCDMYNIPLATNIATAESLVLCLDRGDMEWRDYKLYVVMHRMQP